MQNILVANSCYGHVLDCDCDTNEVKLANRNLEASNSSALISANYRSIICIYFHAVGVQGLKYTLTWHWSTVAVFINKTSDSTLS